MCPFTAVSHTVPAIVVQPQDAHAVALATLPAAFISVAIGVHHTALACRKAEVHFAVPHTNSVYDVSLQGDTPSCLLLFQLPVYRSPEGR